jgi:hypothetical protein
MKASRAAKVARNNNTGNNEIKYKKCIYKFCVWGIL